MNRMHSLRLRQITYICVCRVEDIVRCESAINKDQASFPEHNYNNILKVWTNISNCNAFLSSLGDAPRARKQHFIIHLRVASVFPYAVPVLLYDPLSTGIQR